MVAPAGPALRFGLPVAPCFYGRAGRPYASLRVAGRSFALESVLEVTKSQVFQAFPQHMWEKPQFLAFF
jgi:hypothetical protein